MSDLSDVSDVSAGISRRTALVGGLAGAGLLTLAACSSGDGGGASSNGAGAGGQGAPPASGSGELAAVDSIPVGSAVAANLNGSPVVVARPSATTVACFSAICTHMGCTVTPAGKELHCPCHGSVFDASTGAVISGPATRALDEIPVKVHNGEVVAGG